MAKAPSDDGWRGQPHFEYFVLRIAWNGEGSSAPFQGTVEHLGATEKHSFVNGDELLHLLGMAERRWQPRPAL